MANKAASDKKEVDKNVTEMIDQLVKMLKLRLKNT